LTIQIARYLHLFASDENKLFGTLLN